MVVVFTSIFQIDKKQQIIIKKKTKRECDEFRKGDIVAHAREREKARAKREKRMSPRGEAKQEKGTDKGER